MTMTAKRLAQIARDDKGFGTPELNDILYLHFKGFRALGEPIKAYTGLKSLWLEGCVQTGGAGGL
jgi:hypothetical protein